MPVGLDATVMCSCFRLGQTCSPPFPRDWLHIDAEGYLNLKPEYDSVDRAVEVCRWMETCCHHPNMDAASEHIANWPGYRLFQQAMGKVGWDRFPILRRELPEANGGLTAPSAASMALAELDEFRRCGEVTTTICLVDTAKNIVLQKQINAYEGIFIRDGRSGLEAGIDGSGFYLRDRESGVELFRAARFRQTLQAPQRYRPGPEAGRVLFHDLDSGREFECRTAVPGRTIPWPDGRMEDDRGRCNFEYPPELHVESRAEKPSDFEHIVGPLEKVFRASIEFDNPVRWC